VDECKPLPRGFALGLAASASEPPPETAVAADVNDADADVLRAWREQCPQLRALWDEAGALSRTNSRPTLSQRTKSENKQSTDVESTNQVREQTVDRR